MTLHATDSLAVSLALSEMSPDVPARIAASRPGLPRMRSTESTKSSSPVPTGDIDVRPLAFISQSNSPVAGSYERSLFPPAVPRPVRLWLFQRWRGVYVEWPPL